VTGDDVVCDEASALLGPRLKTLAVKRGLGRFSARHQPPAYARIAIAEAAAEALAALDGAPVYEPGAPCTIEVDLATPDHAEPYRHRAGVTISGGRSLTSTAGTWWDAWRQFYF
jgi:D-amino peptidase